MKSMQVRQNKRKKKGWSKNGLSEALKPPLNPPPWKTPETNITQHWAESVLNNHDKRMNL